MRRKEGRKEGRKEFRVIEIQYIQDKRLKKYKCIIGIKDVVI